MVEMLVSDLSLHQEQVIVYGDGLSTSCPVKDRVHYERTKHIDVRHHFLRSERIIKVMGLSMVNNPTTSMFTKQIHHTTL